MISGLLASQRRDRSTRVALRTGNHVATRLTSVSSAATPPIVTGSVVLTPAKNDRKYSGCRSCGHPTRRPIRTGGTGMTETDFESARRLLHRILERCTFLPNDPGQLMLPVRRTVLAIRPQAYLAEIQSKVECEQGAGIA